jgi:hypothetical protein
MLKGVAGAIAVLITFASLTNAQQPTGAPDQRGPGQIDLKRLTDVRIALVRAGLQLTTEQEKHWPALEEAIRARSAGRQKRIAAAAELVRQQNVDPVDLLRHRADNLAERGAELKKLLDAWQPLWQTLNADQRERLLILATRVLGVVRDAVEIRRTELLEDTGDDWTEYLVQGSR